jgi:hypothetical protein
MTRYRADGSRCAQPNANPAVLAIVWYRPEGSAAVGGVVAAQGSRSLVLAWVRGAFVCRGPRSNPIGSSAGRRPTGSAPRSSTSSRRLSSSKSSLLISKNVSTFGGIVLSFLSDSADQLSSCAARCVRGIRYCQEKAHPALQAANFCARTLTSRAVYLPMRRTGATPPSVRPLLFYVLAKFGGPDDTHGGHHRVGQPGPFLLACGSVSRREDRSAS